MTRNRAFGKNSLPAIDNTVVEKLQFACDNLKLGLNFFRQNNSIHFHWKKIYVLWSTFVKRVKTFNKN